MVIILLIFVRHDRGMVVDNPPAIRLFKIGEAVSGLQHFMLAILVKRKLVEAVIDGNIIENLDMRCR
jgi:hypothetical protein